MTPRGTKARSIGAALAAALLAVSAAKADLKVRFIPITAAHGYAARAYRTIWEEHGEQIVAALERRTCLPFSESSVAAVIADAASHSGGPNHPMRLRASYARRVKQSTLVHELGHRHLWQLPERLDDVDGHMTLYLILDRVWADVWGETFARERVGGESGWRTDYDYGRAWSWALSRGLEERRRLWNRLLIMNGFPGGCDGPIDGVGDG